MSRLPALQMRPKMAGRVAHGHPWAYSNEIAMTPEARSLTPGEVVRLLNADGRHIATGVFNPNSLVAFRVLVREDGTAIDAGFFAERVKRALALRERLYDAPFYRLVHGEADGLPGLVVDRFGDVVSVQLNGAGMERLKEDLLLGLAHILAPKSVVLRRNARERALEGLGAAEEEVEIRGQSLDGPVALSENGLRYRADLVAGQKTGWFYDHRDNRAFAARLARGGDILDLYAYGGGFGLLAAQAGARSVLMVDRSRQALALAQGAARENGLIDRTAFEAAEVFDFLEQAAASGRRYDLVLADPPAFVTSKKALASGLKGYRKLARLAAATVAPQGVLMLASCSQPVSADALLAEMRAGLAAAGRSGRVLRIAGAGADHPIHPHLPEAAYLKAIFVALD